MNLTFVGPPTTGVCVYGRRGRPPTVTDYDWAEVVSEAGEQVRIKRSPMENGLVSVERPLAKGEWYIAVLNGDEADSRQGKEKAALESVIANFWPSIPERCVRS